MISGEALDREWEAWHRGERRGPRAVAFLRYDMGAADTRLPIDESLVWQPYDLVTVGPTHEGMRFTGQVADDRPLVVRGCRFYPFGWIGDEAVAHAAGEQVTFWWTVPAAAPIVWEREREDGD